MPQVEDVLALGARALGALFATGAVDVRDHVEAVLDGLARVDDPALVTCMLTARARTEADASRSRWRAGTPLGPLDGVPIGWKDLFDIAGRVTTAGSVLLATQPPAVMDAPIVTAAKAAGLISVCALNMTEFAYSGIGQNPHFGTPRNPHGKGPARAPGGSSSGSAVAVARKLLPVAMGTDTGGSVRVPAAFNGIVGYKASTGRYPMQGVFPLSRSLDSLGPLARSVVDCIAVDAALRGTTPALEPATLQALTAIVPETVVCEACEPDVLVAFDAALARLAAAGLHIERRPLPQLATIVELIARVGNLVGPEALSVHRDRVDSIAAARMDHRVLARLKAAQTMTALELLELMEARSRLIPEVAALIGDAVVLCPTAPIVAMPMAPLEANDELFFRSNARTLRNTMLGNFLDWCGVSVPNGVDRDGMPTGLLVSARHGRDAAVLAAALAIEPLARAP